MPLRLATGGGDLRSRVTFAQRNDVQDEYGNVSTGWLDRFTVAAQISPRLGGETIDAARLAGRQPVVIRVRNSIDTRAIRTDWKATNVDTGTEYNIRTAVDPDEGGVEHGKWIDMMAEAGVAI